MKTEKLPEIVNIDTANEEISRLAKQLGQATPKFVGDIWEANEEISKLKAEIAKKPVVVQRPTPKLNVAPKPTDPPQPKVETQPLTGLARAIAANVKSQGGDASKVTFPKRTEAMTGLQRAISANIKQSKTKNQ